MPSVTHSPKPENPFEKKIHGLRHYLHGIASTDDGKSHEGLVTVLAEAIEIIESLSVRAVYTDQRLKELRISGEQVIVDPMNPKDLQLVLDEIRSEQAQHITNPDVRDGLSGIQQYFTSTSADQLTRNLRECGLSLDEYIVEKQIEKRNAAEKLVFQPNHFQRYVDLFSHTSTVIASHRRSGKTTEALRLAALFAKANPGTKTLIVTPKAHVDYDIFAHIAREEIESASKWPYRFTLKNGSTISLLPGGSNRNSSIRGFDADRILVEEAGMVVDAVHRDLEPLIFGSKHKPVTTIFFTPFPRYEDMPYVVDHYWNNPKLHRLHYPVTINPDHDREKINEAYAACSAAEWASEWLAIVPEKPKETHVCNCHPRKDL